MQPTGSKCATVQSSLPACVDARCRSEQKGGSVMQASPFAAVGGVEPTPTERQTSLILEAAQDHKVCFHSAIVRHDTNDLNAVSFFAGVAGRYLGSSARGRGSAHCGECEWCTAPPQRQPCTVLGLTQTNPVGVGLNFRERVDIVDLIQTDDELLDKVSLHGAGAARHCHSPRLCCRFSWCSLHCAMRCRTCAQLLESVTTPPFLCLVFPRCVFMAALPHACVHWRRLAEG